MVGHLRRGQAGIGTVFVILSNEELLGQARGKEGTTGAEHQSRVMQWEGCRS